MHLLDRLNRNTVLFYDTEKFFLFDEQGFPAIDLYKHPFRQDRSNAPIVSLKEDEGAQTMISLLAVETEEVQKKYCESTTDLLIKGGGLRWENHIDRFRRMVENFIVSPCPEHSMKWIESASPEFYFWMPYFTAAIFSLLGKMIVRLDRLDVEAA